MVKCYKLIKWLKIEWLKIINIGIEWVVEVTELYRWLEILKSMDEMVENTKGYKILPTTQTNEN